MEEFRMKDKDCIFCKIANGEISIGYDLRG